MEAQIRRLAAAIKTISETYLTRVVKSGDIAAIQKWSLRLADYSTRLAVLTAPAGAALTAKEAAVFAPPVETAPNYGDRPEMSSALYGEWVSNWFQNTFPEAYRDYPPVVHAVDPSAIADAAKKDGCLAQVCAAGVLGWPGGPWAFMGDWSLYSALVSTDDEHSVFHMGNLVGIQNGGDGLEFAKDLGFNW